MLFSSGTKDYEEDGSRRGYDAETYSHLFYEDLLAKEEAER